MKITQERLMQLLRYDAETGMFTRIGRNCKVGTKMEKGYIRIEIDGFGYLAHVLAWLYVFGEYPKDQLDHINEVKDDNRIANLRQVTNAQNRQNLSKAASSNKSTGLLGSYFHKSTGKYRAKITVNKKTISLGLFESPELAHLAYVKAKREYHPFGRL